MLYGSQSYKVDMSEFGYWQCACSIIGVFDILVPILIFALAKSRQCGKHINSEVKVFLFNSVLTRQCYHLANLNKNMAKNSKHGYTLVIHTTASSSELSFVKFSSGYFLMFMFVSYFSKQ